MLCSRIEYRQGPAYSSMNGQSGVSQTHIYMFRTYKIPKYFVCSNQLRHAVNNIAIRVSVSAFIRYSNVAGEFFLSSSKSSASMSPTVQ